MRCWWWPLLLPLLLLLPAVVAGVVDAKAVSFGVCVGVWGGGGGGGVSVARSLRR